MNIVPSLSGIMHYYDKLKRHKMTKLSGISDSIGRFCAIINGIWHQPGAHGFWFDLRLSPSASFKIDLIKAGVAQLMANFGVSAVHKKFRYIRPIKTIYI